MRVFSEEQRFNQWWFQLINLSVIFCLGYICYTWFIAETDKANPEKVSLVLQLIVIGSMVLTILLLYLIKLKTEINEIGIHYQYNPFHTSKKTIRWDEIEACYTRKYNAIKEFGGWGYKIKFGRGKALTVKGNQGIQIVLKTGKKLLIGTQKMEEVGGVIKRFIKEG